MKILKNELESELNLRTQLNFPAEGVEFIDITPLILQRNVLEEITTKFYEELKDKELDYLVLPEARGFLFGTAVADRLKVGVIPVRKKGKLPPNFVEATFDFTKEYGKDTFEIPKLVDGKYEGKRFYVIDDIYATGNTIKSIVKTISDLGGIVVGTGAVVNIPALNDDKDVFTLIDVEETNE